MHRSLSNRVQDRCGLTTSVASEGELVTSNLPTCAAPAKPLLPKAGLLLLVALLRTAAAVNVPFNSPLGTSMLTSSATLASGFYALAPGWTPQSTLSYHASLATTAAILNALAAAPPDPATGFSWATQADLFGSACVRSLGTHSGAAFSAAWLAANGVTLDEWAAYVRCFASVQQTHANVATPDTFRAALTAALGSSPPRFVAANYFRSQLGQTGGGHMSPLGAYAPGYDAVLVMDVQPWRGYGWVWVPVPDLFRAMNTSDPDAGVVRGWIEVSAPVSAPAFVQPPPVNVSGGRACAAALPSPNDAEAVQACMRTSGALNLPLPPPSSSTPAPACQATASGGSTVFILLLLACGAAAGFWIYARSRRSASAAAPGEGGARLAAAVEVDGVLLLSPRDAK